MINVSALILLICDFTGGKKRTGLQIHENLGCAWCNEMIGVGNLMVENCAVIMCALIEVTRSEKGTRCPASIVKR